MAVMIGSARIDEYGNISNGAAGDQTGKEVAVENYYNHSKGWVVLRAIDDDIAEKIAKCMEDACANPAIGYDQNQRSTLYNAVKDNGFKCDRASLTKKVETDCSALVRVCLGYAGIKIADIYTGNLKAVVLDTGKFKEVKCGASDLKRGDILVTKVKGHTAIVVQGSAKVTAPSAVKVDSAKSFQRELAGTYRVTSDLNLRAGAGVLKKKICVIPKNDKVKNYGYYTTVLGTKWFLVAYDGKTGFCSSKYLMRG